MTTAPPSLLAVRALLRQHLGLPSVALGIVGDPAHRGGYHCGRDRVLQADYSVIESPRDTRGLSDYASALDIGRFRVTVRGQVHDLRTFSTWLVDQCRAGTRDTADIREVIYSPDGRVVRRWDRLGRRTRGDLSHLDHTHVSYHRDATAAGRDLDGVFRRYLTTIGLLPPPAPVPAATEAATTPTRRAPTMILIKTPTESTVYLSWGAGRAALTDYEDQMVPLQKAGVPLIVARDAAELDTICGPLRTSVTAS